MLLLLLHKVMVSIANVMQKVTAVLVHFPPGLAQSYLPHDATSTLQFSH